uniref:(northern house mosquito) hypothetical protein n=1 Tax=Culex pipiens TaxID=7175 RepID=A0A8D8G035_CULPI
MTKSVDFCFETYPLRHYFGTFVKFSIIIYFQEYFIKVRPILQHFLSLCLFFHQLVCQSMTLLSSFHRRRNAFWLRCYKIAYNVAPVRNRFDKNSAARNKNSGVMKMDP